MAQKKSPAKAAPETKAAAKKAANAALAKGAKEIAAAAAGKPAAGAKKPAAKKAPATPAPAASAEPTPAPATDAAAAGKPPVTTPKFELVPQGEQMLLEIVASTRPVNEIIDQYIKPRPSGIGLEISADLPPDQWAAAAAYYGSLADHIGFYIGDLLRFAEVNFAEKYTAAVKASGLKIKTLQNYTVTATKVLPENRVPELGYSIHAEVTKLTPANQRKVLEKAKKHGWTVKQTREEVQRLTAPAPTNPPPTPPETPAPATDTLKVIGVDTVAGTETVEDAAGNITTRKIGAPPIPPAQADSDLPGTGGTEAPAAPATGTPAPAGSKAEKLSPEAAADNETHIELADTLTDFLKGATFKKLPPVNLKQWARILKTYAKILAELEAQGIKAD